MIVYFECLHSVDVTEVAKLRSIYMKINYILIMGVLCLLCCKVEEVENDKQTINAIGEIYFMELINCLFLFLQVFFFFIR